MWCHDCREDITIGQVGLGVLGGVWLYTFVRLVFLRSTGALLVKLAWSLV